jgi:hypothetical protein
MEQGTRKYTVSSDDKQSDLQRESLLAAGTKRGMTIVLPAAASNGKPGGDITLSGHLVWSDQDLGWATDWQLIVEGKLHRWQVRGVTFDEAFRRGIGGAAEILSGNGDPH